MLCSSSVLVTVHVTTSPSAIASKDTANFPFPNGVVYSPPLSRILVDVPPSEGTSEGSVGLSAAQDDNIDTDTLIATTEIVFQMYIIGLEISPT